MDETSQQSDLLCCRISRARNVLALSTLNYSRSLPPMTSSVPGLYIVNSAHIVNGTLNVDEVIRLAERALEECLARDPIEVGSGVGNRTTRVSCG